MTGKHDVAGNEIPLVFPTPKQMQWSSEAFVEALNLSTLSDFINGYPSVPDEPGLYAVVAPDGVTAKVVEPSMGAHEIRRIILLDVVRRLMRSFYRDCIERNMSFDQITEKAFPQLLVLKKQYRLEKLGG